MKTIDEDIRSGNLKQIYLLYGTEDYLKRQYRDKLKNALTAAGEDSGMGGMLSGGDGDMNFNRFEGKDINPKQVIDLAETLPFFAERRVILIENSGFFKNACDELAEYLAQPAASTYFVFVEEEVDKRSKMYKAVKNAGKIVEFATQTEELITRWVLARLKKEGKNITGSVMQLFLSKTGSDMGNIDRELEKLICKIYEDHVLGKLSDARYAALAAQYAKEQNELECEIVQLEKAVSGYEQNRKSAERFIALIDKYENFDTLTTTMLNEFVEKILVHERARKGSQDTTQEVEIYFNFVGKYMPPHFGEVTLTPEEQEELRKREERKDKLHQNYLRRKASGAQKAWEKRYNAKRKAQIEAAKAAIREEDISNGVFIPVGQLPQQVPQKAPVQAHAAV